MSNGLPSNHIYGLRTDRNGYLWIATPEGISRYNGYGVQVFNTSDGLPTSDIWEMFEDKKGRLWLMNFSQTLGYIVNGQYRSAVIRDSLLRVLPVAHSVGNHEQGVFFVNGSKGILVEYNDTFYYSGLQITDPVLKWGANKEGISASVFSSKDFIGGAALVNLKVNAGRVARSYQRIPAGYQFLFQFNEYVLLYRNGSSVLLSYNVNNGKFKQLQLDQPVETAKCIPGSNSILYLLINSMYYKMNDTLGVVDKWDIEQRAFPPVSLSWVVDDSIWGTCMGVAGKGVYVPSERQPSFIPLSLNLLEERGVGIGADDRPYWWNSSRKQLVSLDYTNSSLSRRPIVEFNNSLLKIFPYDEDHSLLVVAMAGVFLLNSHTGVIKPYLRLEQVSVINRHDPVSPLELFRCHDLLVTGKELYLISRQYGLAKINLTSGATHLLMQHEDYIGEGSDYKQLLYDPLTKSLWAYGNKEAVRYVTGPNDTPKLVKTRNRWLKGIEQVLFDEKHGNIFVLWSGDLYMVNRRTGIITALNQSMNMDKGLIYLKDSLLVAAGRFGVGCFVINGEGQISPPIIYEQFRDQYYSAINDIQLIDTNLYMFTNNGGFLLRQSRSDVVRAKQKDKTGRLIVSDNDRTFHVTTGDTLRVSAGALALGFDFINPAANGVARFEYHLLETGERWQKTGSNEVMFPDLVPNRYYTLDVQVRDNARVHSARIHLYIIPEWYQTPWMSVVWVLAALITTALFVLLIVSLTRLYTKREHLQRNLRMDIELKAIYAQINPHFIYNTLNSILLMIRMGNNNDAFYNVSKFSKLLRAYIKSSRNRYITVGEEIENLKNYIELQQARFAGRFSYAINVEDPVGGLEERRIPSLVLQPIVENAINHGLFHKESPGLLNITFQTRGEGNEILCIIEDDGVGRKEADRINKASTLKAASYGSLLVEDLIAILNKYEQSDITIEYIDKQAPLTGTIVKLRIK